MRRCGRVGAVPGPDYDRAAGGGCRWARGSVHATGVASTPKRMSHRCSDAWWSYVGSPVPEDLRPDILSGTKDSGRSRAERMGYEYRQAEGLMQRRPPFSTAAAGTAALLRAAFLGWLHPPPLARDAQARNPDPTENPKEICEGKGRNDLVFPGENGHHLRLARVHEDNMSWFGSAVKRTGIPRITPHDLRPSAASFAVSSGANVKVVQKMLGHSSAAMTLDTYADLLDGDLDSVSDALDHAVSLANVPRMCPRV